MTEPGSPYSTPRANVDNEPAPDRGDVGHGFFVGAAAIFAGFAVAMFVPFLATGLLGPASPVAMALVVLGLAAPLLGPAAMAARCASRGQTLSVWGVLLVSVMFCGPYVAWVLL